MPLISRFGALSARALGFCSAAPPLLASASPSSVSGTAHSSSTVTVTSGSTTVTASGGVAPYTYAWTRSSGSFSITSPTSASTTFSESLGSNVSDGGTAVCTVTDAAGQTATASVSVSLANTYNPPTWNVGNGTNMGTFPRGGSTQQLDLYATCSGGVSYSILGQFSYPTGFGPNVVFGAGQGPGSGHVQGSASSDCTPGTYSATVSALNPSEGTSSTIAVYVTVT